MGQKFSGNDKATRENRVQCLLFAANNFIPCPEYLSFIEKIKVLHFSGFLCVLKGCESMSSEVRNQIKRMIIRKKDPRERNNQWKKKTDITAQSSPINISSNNTAFGWAPDRTNPAKTPLWPIPTSVTSPGPLCHAPKINSRVWWSDHRDPPGTWA